MSETPNTTIEEMERIAAPTLRPEVAKVRDLITTLFKALVDREDEVVVHVVAGRHNVIFEVDVHEKDVPFAVGKSGATADAVRTILRAACKKHRIKYELEVLEKRNAH